MKLELLDEDSYKIFVNNSYIKEFNINNNEELSKYIKSIILKIRKIYDVILEGFYEVAIEMYNRKIKFTNIDLEKSMDENFIVDKENNAIIPPFIAIDGLGNAAATSIVEARKQAPFVSKEDLQKRTKLNSTNIKNLEKLGVLKSLNEMDQLDIFLI